MFAGRRAVRGMKRDFVAMLRHLDAPTGEALSNRPLSG